MKTPIDVVVKGQEFVNRLTPDGILGRAPAWHGWAVRAAFIEGYRQGQESATPQKVLCVKCNHEVGACCIVANDVCWRCVAEWVYEHDDNPAKDSPEEIAFRIARGKPDSAIAVGGVLIASA